MLVHAVRGLVGMRIADSPREREAAGERFGEVLSETVWRDKHRDGMDPPAELGGQWQRTTVTVDGPSREAQLARWTDAGPRTSTSTPSRWRSRGQKRCAASQPLSSTCATASQTTTSRGPGWSAIRIGPLRAATIDRRGRGSYTASRI